MKFSPFLVLCVLLCLVGIASSAHLKQEVPWELSQALPTVCQLPPARGPCRGVFSRYFYNDTSSECEHFAYGGCQGNANNFETTEICLRICKHPGEPSENRSSPLSPQCYAQGSSTRQPEPFEGKADLTVPWGPD